MKIVKHWKGGLYSVIALNGIASSDMEEGDDLMVYVSLQDGRLYVRTIASANERVRSKDGLQIGPPRFTSISEEEGEKLIKKRMKQLGLEKVYAQKRAEVEAKRRIMQDMLGRDSRQRVMSTGFEQLYGKGSKTFMLNEQHTTHVTKSQARKERAAAKRSKR